ncbi:hypothetical protein MTR67_017908 [Solanum verrucosum]|uniref:Tf2-1-like SH3-like domain-containing protein n=1 Tax=Solanum verrucosum TaxID=315347 RepID=A0AAF0QK15_SOLVR|nr:hypothetical protein MTR67_017908 [Solanum verrucosum]
MGGGIGLQLVCSRIGKVAYKLEFPMEFAVAHPVFHVSLLKKCVGDPSLIVPIETIGIKYSLSFEEEAKEDMKDRYPELLVHQDDEAGDPKFWKYGDAIWITSRPFTRIEAQDLQRMQGLFMNMEVVEMVLKTSKGFHTLKIA